MLKNRRHKIYCLIDPRNGEVYYVGVTVMDLKLRLIGHLSKYSNTGGIFSIKRYKIAKALEKQSLRPDIIKLKTCGIDKVDFYEKKYYEYFKRVGFEMLQSSTQFTYSKSQSRFYKTENTSKKQS